MHAGGAAPPSESARACLNNMNKEEHRSPVDRSTTLTSPHDRLFPTHRGTIQHRAHLPRHFLQHCYLYPGPLTCTGITLKRFGLAGKSFRIIFPLRPVCVFFSLSVFSFPGSRGASWLGMRVLRLVSLSESLTIRNPRPCRVSQRVSVDGDGTQPKLNGPNQYKPSHFFLFLLRYLPA